MTFRRSSLLGLIKFKKKFPLKGEVGEEVREAVARADTLVRAWALRTEYGLRVRVMSTTSPSR